MKILVLGGTQLVGRHVVEALLAGGHVVSILNRGKTPDELPAQVERLRGDRDLGVDGLAELQDRTWDACVDASGFTPRQVRPSAEKLKGRVKRYVFISAVSVYGNPKHGPVEERHRRLEPAGEEVTEINAETYGPLKVACENIVKKIHRRKCTILRPQIVAGPHDPYDRYAYWVRRATQGGEMLAPGDGSDHVQVIDARDFARFTRTVIENDLSGAFNMSGPRLTWTEFLKILDAKDLVWVPAEIIRAAGVKEAELPLYRREGEPRSQLMNVSNEWAIKSGLTLTDPAVTAADMRLWITGRMVTAALSREKEVELIRRVRTGR